MLIIYNLFIRCYVLAIKIAALRNTKAKSWINGRKNWADELSAKISPNDRTIWMHCASAGEFEQGKPVIEALREEYPGHKIVVSFFSPSGFSAARKYSPSDVITYLPADTRRNAGQFLNGVHPELVIFVKYEFWYHHLSAAAFRHIPMLLVSGIFRKQQLFFKPYGKFYRQMLFLFRHLFVQDQTSLDLLKEYGVNHASLAGDTRFDRVKKIAGAFIELPLIKAFAGESKVIVAGSTWPGDEEILSAYAKNREMKIIIAPHELSHQHVSSLQKSFPACVLFSEVNNLFSSENENRDASIWSAINEQQQKALFQKLAAAKTLIIDTMGLLARLYYYGTVTYVGGGFKSGIHNTLEAAVYGKPVLFGPKYHKFKEARDLIERGAAFSVENLQALGKTLDLLLNDAENLKRASHAAMEYIEESTGATAKILGYIQENRLLTS